MAVYAFAGDKEDELGFEEGDLIVILDKPEGGWWQGECNGRVCVFVHHTCFTSLKFRIHPTAHVHRRAAIADHGQYPHAQHTIFPLSAIYCQKLHIANPSVYGPASDE